MTSGVAQGSRIGPLLFSIFINDIDQVVKYANLELFADDCKLSITIDNELDSIKMQDDLDRVTQWIKSNKLQINESKCHAISFSRTSNFTNYNYKIAETIIQHVDMVRDLGIILDRKWLFQDHINMVLAKSFRTLGFIKRTTFSFSSTDCITYLFKTLVLPGLNYGSVIWSPHHKEKFKALNKVITKFLRYASYKMGNPMSIQNHDYKDISTKCKIFKIESMHKYNDLCYIMDNLIGKINSSDFETNFKKRDNTHRIRNFKPFTEEIIREKYIYIMRQLTDYEGIGIRYQKTSEKNYLNLALKKN